MPLPKGLGLSRTMPFNPAIRKGCFWLWNIQEGALGDMLAFEHTLLPLLRTPFFSAGSERWLVN